MRPWLILLTQASLAADWKKKEAAILCWIAFEPSCKSGTMGNTAFGERIEMRVAGLFSGIAGLEFGLNETGHETVLLSEIWVPAAAVL